MPFLGIGLHVIVALFFAIHAIRTRREMYWLFVLFSFPLLGSVVYFFAIYLPQSRMERSLNKVAKLAMKSLDPGRDLREATQAFDLTPTAQNQMRLAAALLTAGQAEAAAQNYEACLNGLYKNDPAIRLAAAEARFANQEPALALNHLQQLRLANPEFRAEVVTLLLARVLGANGAKAEAHREFAAAVARSDHFDSHAAYALWAKSVGDEEVAAREFQAVQQICRHWDRQTRDLNRDELSALQKAFGEKP